MKGKNLTVRFIDHFPFLFTRIPLFFFFPQAISPLIFICTPGQLFLSPHTPKDTAVGSR